MVINSDQISMVNGSKRIVPGDKMVPYAVECMAEKLDLKSG